MQTRREQNPPYGWQVVQLGPVLLDNPGGVNPDTSPVFERGGGLHRLSVQITVTAVAGVAGDRFGLFIEGSNTGDTSNPLEWIRLSSLNLSEVFDAGDPAVLGSVRVIGGDFVVNQFQGEGQVSIGRWHFLRLRTEIVSGTPTFTLDVRAVAIAGDGERMDRNVTVRKFGGNISLIYFSDSFLRPAGTRYMSSQAFAVDIVPAAGDGWHVQIQGALDQSAVDAGEWHDLDFSGPLPGTGALVVTGDSYFFEQDQIQLIDMGPFNYFRFVVTSAGVFDSASAFQILFSSVVDDDDWLDADIGLTKLNEGLREVLCQVVFGLPPYGAPVAPSPAGPPVGTLSIPYQVCDTNGRPLLGARNILFTLSDIKGAGRLSPHPTATFEGVDNAGVMGQGRVVPPGLLLPPGGFGTFMYVRTGDLGSGAVEVFAPALTPDVWLGADNQVPPLPRSAFTAVAPNVVEIAPGQVVIASMFVNPLF